MHRSTTVHADERNAVDGYFAYFGTYSIDVSRSAVTHHVTGASFPNWIALDLVRQFTLENEALLRLSTPPIEVARRTLEYVRVWERMA